MIGNGCSRNKLMMKYPASWHGNMWREALPTGNGRIGAAVYGGVHKETVLLNHGELWYGGKKDFLPDVGYTLAEVRKLMTEGKYKEANGVLTGTLKEKGYDSRTASVLPFADLKLTMSCRNGFRHYQRCLDMETGEVSVRWKDGKTAYERSLFVSRTDNMVVYQIKTDHEPIDAQLFLTMQDTGDSSSGFNDMEVLNSLEVKAEGQCIYYAAANDDGTDFGAVMRIIPTGGELKAEEDKINVKNAENVLVFVELFVKGDRKKDWRFMQTKLESVNSDYSSLLKPHVNIHRCLFNSASVILSEAEEEKSNEEFLLEAYQGEPANRLIEKMWAYGRYLFISAAREDGYPCALYGLWCGDYNPIWCQHIANENVEMIYWHASVGGLSELMSTLFNYLDGMMDDFKENASKLFGCRGINIHGYTSPGIGVANVLVPVITNWTGAAGWLARFYYEYYLYTGDLEFLRKRALPFMREAALFYEDFFTMGQDGYLVSYPSVSPENSPGKFWDKDDTLTHPMPTAINATADFAIAKELLGNLIKAATLTGEFSSEIEKWRDMLERIPPYQVNGDGVVKEWMHPFFDDNYNHRHMSHLYPVFPGQEVFKERDPILFKAFVKAVEKRLIVGLSHQSGWSLTHMACIYARMGEGDLALECLDFRQAPFQIDANMGFTNAVQEMLVYSSPEIVKIMPAVPSKWKKGCIKNLRFCTGRVSFSWDTDNGKFNAELYAERETKVLLKLPKEFSQYLFKCEDSSVFTSVYEDNCFDVIIEPGDCFCVKAG